MRRVLRLALIQLAWITASAEPSDSLRSGALNPSALCAQCHQEIHAVWQNSMHSLAYRDPIFQTSYMQAYKETAGEARRICLRCHAPVATLTGDLEVRQPMSQEGVSCDYCHSIASVDLTQPRQPYRVVLDGIKRGPLPDSESAAHRVAKSALHESSEFCAGCHEYVSDRGLPLLTTYSEWKLSPQAAEGKTCQSCHMPAVPGDSVRAGFGTVHKSINLHDVSGGHSSEQVRKAATAKILSLKREERTRAVIEVEVANVGSGHFIPTGLPTRRLILELTLFRDGREFRRFERIYEKKLLDAEGKAITEDHRAMLDARTIAGDTRLRPGERRLEQFVTEVPEKGSLRAEMELRYAYLPQIISRQEMSIQITSDHSP